MTIFTLDIQGYRSFAGEFQVEATLPPSEFWMHKDDLSIDGAPRTCAPCPSVWPYLDDKVEVTRQWQYFIRGINPGMTLQYVAVKFGPALAFCNRDEEDIRADWLRERDLDRPNPDFDRVRTCSRSILSGTVSGSELVVSMLDGNREPPLKPGRTYPQRVEDIQVDDYLYVPWTHRHLFFAANRITKEGTLVPFPNGGLCPWMGDMRPYTWMPHVARREVRIPLLNLVRLPEEFVPNPYNP